MEERLPKLFVYCAYLYEKLAFLIGLTSYTFGWKTESVCLTVDDDLVLYISVEVGVLTEGLLKL